MKLELLLGLLLFGSVSVATAQDKGTLEESNAVKEIMKVKEEVIKSEKTFQIQLFNGKLESANEVLEAARKAFSLPVNMSFETPNYKVRLGKFRTRMEAEKVLSEVRENYPSAFVMYI